MGVAQLDAMSTRPLIHPMTVDQLMSLCTISFALSTTKLIVEILTLELLRDSKR